MDINYWIGRNIHFKRNYHKSNELKSEGKNFLIFNIYNKFSEYATHDY